MVLKGSLREFILADIFNLLTQQKITGKLLLSSIGNEGIIAFRNGVIVGASKGEEQLGAKLFNLVVDVFHYSQEEMRGLFTSFDNDINTLFQEILRLNLIKKEALESMATSVVEDITCSFFLWTKGTYYFSSVSYVDDIAPACVAISVETIIMEAMRRVDEWNRMTKLIQDDTIFIPRERPDTAVVAQEIDPITQPEEFIYSKLDGLSTVGTLFRASCLTEYTTYEAINSLLGAERIVPLPTKISQSVVAALEKKAREKKKSTMPLIATVAVCSTLLVVLTVYFFGSILFHRMIFSRLEIDSRLYRLELPLAETVRKTAIASLQYHAVQGAPNAGVDDLMKASFLSETDLRPLSQIKSIKKLPIAWKKYILFPGVPPEEKN